MSLARKMDRLAPVRIEVPSGADVRIDYETEGDPVLRVRLQEMFGLARTPAIAEGRSPLRIELLSPAGRPAGRHPVARNLLDQRLPLGPLRHARALPQACLAGGPAQCRAGEAAAAALISTDRTLPTRVRT